MDERSLRALEWDRVTTLLSLCASSQEGRARALGVRPWTEEGRIRECHAAVHECAERDRLCGRLSLEAYGRCPTETIAGRSFPLEELVRLKDNLSVRAHVTRWLADPGCEARVLAASFPPSDALDALSHSLERTLDRRGRVADGASPALRSIRRERERLRGSLQHKMESLVGHFAEEALQEATYTIRNGRLVLPVQSSRRSRVRGILHDSSSTGATVYIEPMEAVEDNNRLAELDAEEREEVQRILVEISAEVTASSSELESLFDALEELDALLARARFGRIYGGVLPRLESRGGRIRLEKAIHPLLDDRLHGLRQQAWGEKRRSAVVPLDLALDLEGTKTLVISGPNAGGKTVALKTAGLLCAMAQAGIPIPAAEGTTLPLVRHLFALLGDDQSILESLSTFSAKMVHLRDTLKSLREPFLVLLDELGAGTDPIEGGAIGEATLLALHGRRGFVLSTTHHESLKGRALVTEGMGNACMEFDENGMEPTYRLTMGKVGASRALLIAERMGLPADLLESARSLLPGEEKRLKGVLEALEAEIETHRAMRADLDAHRRRLQADREALAGEREAAAAERREFEASLPKRLDDWERRFLASLKSEVNLKAVRRRAVRERGRVMEAAHREIGPAGEPPPAEEIPGVGDRVSVSAYGVEGEITASDPEVGRLTVDCGGKSLQVGLRDVTILEAAKPEPVRGGVYVSFDSDGVLRELNLIGHTVAEAEMRLEPFLDRAALAGLPSVRVIHGIGTGRLRTAVQAFLRKSPHVKGFEEAAPANGGAGATEITIR